MCRRLLTWVLRFLQQGGGAEHSTFRHAFKLEAGAEEGTPRSTVYVRLLGPFAAACVPLLMATFFCRAHEQAA